MYDQSTITETALYNTTFAKDVHEGLAAYPKRLSSKYFYDEIGDALFVKIMSLPEYYLTRSEMEIFQTQTENIIAAMDLQQDKYFELIELGAGDGLKTKVFLSTLVKNNYSFTYVPLDISGHALQQLKTSIENEIPGVRVEPVEGDYFTSLTKLKQTQNPKIVLFLGSSIGNMLDETATMFVNKLAEDLQPGDKLLLGVDLLKPKEIVLPAYNDAQGVTRDFNLNLLRRINEELGANFNLEAFEHIPYYTEEEGIAKSFLKSKKEQMVNIAATSSVYHFSKGESIHTEISRKYNDEIIGKITKKSRLVIDQKFTDSKNYFADYLLEKR